MTTIERLVPEPPGACPDDVLARERAGRRDADSWVAAGQGHALQLPRPTREIPLPVPDADADAEPLPEFELWHDPTIAQLGRELSNAEGDLDRLGRLSQIIDLTYTARLSDRRLGQVFTYKQQCNGELVQNLIPLRGREQENSNAGRKAFPWHSDDARLDIWYRVEDLGLLGVDNRGDVPTRLLPVDSVVDRLDRRALRHLCQPRYTQAVPQSYDIPDREGLRSPARPVLAESNEGYRIRYTIYATRPVPGDHAAARALQTLREAVEAAPSKSVVLHAGDILLFSNSRFLHSRGIVGGQRWIKRVYLKRDLSELARVCVTSREGVFDVVPAIRASSLPLPW